MKGCVIVVAGSDSGGGAGIQADIKTITALNGFAMTAVTALTAQNTLTVSNIHKTPPEFVAEQIRITIEDLGADAIKTGMMVDSSIIEVVAALAAGLRHDSGEEIVLFVVPRKEATFDDQLKLEIRNAIRTAASPRHVPRYIVAVSDLPKTRNGKLAEISVTQILRGESVTNVESLANPEALHEFVEARDLLLADKIES